MTRMRKASGQAGSEVRIRSWRSDIYALLAVLWMTLVVLEQWLIHGAPGVGLNRLPAEIRSTQQEIERIVRPPNLGRPSP